MTQRNVTRGLCQPRRYHLLVTDEDDFIANKLPRGGEGACDDIPRRIIATEGVNRYAHERDPAAKLVCSTR
jgi:hypothetical protein